MMVVLTHDHAGTSERSGPVGSHDPADPGVHEDQVQYWKVRSEIPMNGVPSTVPSWP